MSQHLISTARHRLTEGSSAVPVGDHAEADSAPLDREWLAEWWREQRVCVTGADGFIGRRMVGYLAGAGVTSIVSFSRSAMASERAAVTVRQGSVLDGEQLSDAIRGCSVVLHLAGATRRSDEHSYFDVNERGAAMVAEACVREGIQTLVHVSTAYVYGASEHIPITEAEPTRPLGRYAESKLAGERAVRHAAGRQVRGFVARLANVYATDSAPDTVVGSALAQVAAGRLTFRDLAPVRDFIHVDDAVEALLRLGASADPSWPVVNVSSGEGTSIRELAEIVADAATALGLQRAQVEELGRYPPDPIPVIVLDNHRLRGRTAWWPRISLIEGIERALAEIVGQRERHI